MDTELEKAIVEGVKKKKNGKADDSKKVDEMEVVAEDILSAIGSKDKKRLARALRAAKGI